MPKTTALAKREPNEIEFTQERVDLLKKTIMPPGSTDDELALFVEICKRRKLDPFARQIYAIRRKQRVNGQWLEVTKAETSIDGFRAIAERNPAYAGQLGPWWCGKDGKWVEVWTEDAPPFAAKVGVQRSDFKEPLYSIAKFDAYKATFTDGKPMGLWGKMPDNQIAKCAEALALRRAFPEDLSGLYTGDEMQQADPQLEARVNEPELGEPVPPKHVVETEAKKPEPPKRAERDPEPERQIRIVESEPFAGTKLCHACEVEAKAGTGDGDVYFENECAKHTVKAPITQTRNFKFMEAMANQKKRVGTAAYYKILGGAGYEHCSEMTDRAVQKLAFKLLQDLPDEAPPPEDGDNPW